jgi:hypothetical protein
MLSLKQKRSVADIYKPINELSTRDHARGHHMKPVFISFCSNVSLTDYRMTYISTEQVSEKYKIEHSVTIDKNRTNDIQGPEEEDKQQLQSTTNTVF